MNEEALVLQDLEKGNRDLVWLNKHYSGLQKVYSNNFIAIKDSKVFLVEPKLTDLVDKIKKKNEDPAEYLIDFVYGKGDSLVV